MVKPGGKQNRHLHTVTDADTKDAQIPQDQESNSEDAAVPFDAQDWIEEVHHFAPEIDEQVWLDVRNAITKNALKDPDHYLNRARNLFEQIIHETFSSDEDTFVLYGQKFSKDVRFLGIKEPHAREFTKAFGLEIDGVFATAEIMRSADLENPELIEDFEAFRAFGNLDETEQFEVVSKLLENAMALRSRMQKLNVRRDLSYAGSVSPALFCTVEDFDRTIERALILAQNTTAQKIADLKNDRAVVEFIMKDPRINLRVINAMWRERFIAAVVGSEHPTMGNHPSTNVVKKPQNKPDSRSDATQRLGPGGSNASDTISRGTNVAVTRTPGINIPGGLAPELGSNVIEFRSR